MQEGRKEGQISTLKEGRRKLNKGRRKETTNARRKIKEGRKEGKQEVQRNTGKKAGGKETIH
jgi:hypothetical protein